jgi:hypothetical protein
MKKPKKQGRLDFAQLAKAVVDAATDEAPPADGKDAAKVAAGRKGGQLGGAARAKSMSAKQRSASAKKAAKTRWARKKKQAP